MGNNFGDNLLPFPYKMALVCTSGRQSEILLALVWKRNRDIFVNNCDKLWHGNGNGTT